MLYALPVKGLTVGSAPAAPFAAGGASVNTSSFRLRSVILWQDDAAVL